MRFNQLGRREFITLLVGAAVRPLAARAQQTAAELPRICSIHTARNENWESFFRGLRNAGYVDGQNVRIDARFHGAVLERLDEVAREFVALKCSVIFASNPYAIQVVTKATKTIPIIGVDLESDPVASGLVNSVARPGGNFTGFFLDIPELGGKLIELLTEAVPAVSRLAVLWDATIGEVQFHATESARRPAGILLQSLPIRREQDINESIQHAVRDQANGLVVLSSPLIYEQRSQIGSVALNARLPTISLFNTFPKEGGLMAYGPDFPAIYTRAADYVARVLSGANPGELPIQRPTKFELAINLKTARTLGLTVPPTLLGRADEVIE
jgi:putative ABC transport system substrate-binding protein